MPNSTTRSPGPSGRPSDRYADPGWRRLALAPSLLAALALLGGSVLIDTDAFTIFRYIIAIFALICLVFAVQARHWWWPPPFAAIAVLWNPVFVIEVAGPWWIGAQFAAAIVFVVAGVLIKVPVKAEGAR